tara:strand:- start:28 stop:321 length:294 start_codon:yes stop_codon:yes gene_type:complete
MSEFENSIRMLIKRVVDFTLSEDVTCSKDIVIKILNEEWDNFNKAEYAHSQLSKYISTINETDLIIEGYLEAIKSHNDSVIKYKDRLPKLQEIVDNL